tara:strand:+ start:8423 stop:9478 length:1056 start_codon:yes stop_codon:yes gene_type:complete
VSLTELNLELLLLYIALAILVSFFCSVLEAVLLSITPSYQESLRHQHPKLFARVSKLRLDIERPLSAILSFNTIAHTIGAAGAGAQAQKIWGDEVLTVFSVFLTFGILLFSEIIPKSIGARYWRGLLNFASRVLPPMILLSIPLVKVSEFFSKLIKGGDQERVSRAEISAFAELGSKEGVLAPQEAKTIKTMLNFQSLRAFDVMTPREQVAGHPHDRTVVEAFALDATINHSRLLLFGVDRDDIRGYVLRTDILSSMARDQVETVMDDLRRPILILPERIRVGRLFTKLIDRSEHIAAVVDDNGAFRGVVTLEDIMETLLGLEILDEIDVDDELQEKTKEIVQRTKKRIQS